MTGATTVVKPRLRGKAFLVRYADDAVFVFEHDADARRVFDVLPKRFEKYGLKLHPDKTRLVRFERPRWRAKPSRGERPETFDFLGLTHYWGRSRRGLWVVKRKTTRDRFRRSLKAIKAWCRFHRHQKTREQHDALSKKLSGHYAYFGVVGNYAALFRFRYEVLRLWKKWMERRSQRRLPWERWLRLLARYPLPRPRIYGRQT